VNVAELFRLRFQSLVARALAVSEIASRTGLAGASEVWGGDEPRERPAWYLWLRDAPGAWQLELSGAEPLGSSGSTLVGRFTIRHYPSPAAAGFASFSPEERGIAAGSLDGTGTPRIELASRIPDALFTVGSVEWALDLDGDAAVFALASLDRLRTRDGRGEIVRDVPGWSLTVPIFSLLAGLHAQVERRAAARLVVSRQPGFERIAHGGVVEHRDAQDTVQGEALLLFPPAGTPAGTGALLLDGLHDPDAEVLADVSFAPAAHPSHAVDGDPRVPLRVSEAWFGGRPCVADRILCAC
jgi:hypothetical protein